MGGLQHGIEESRHEKGIEENRQEKGIGQTPESERAPRAHQESSRRGRQAAGARTGRKHRPAGTEDRVGGTGRTTEADIYVPTYIVAISIADVTRWAKSSLS